MNMSMVTANSVAFVLLLIALCQPRQSSAFFGSEPKKGRVLLRDVGAITLRRGQMTTGRRSSPVPQLECLSGCHLGGSLDVVQCHNAGWDGNDVQWECRADMDNSYRFGHIAVSCEGYDYPEDPYVLAGSCGLKYSIELTEEGRRTGGAQRGYHDNYEYGRGSYSGHHYSYQQQNSNVGSWTLLVIVALIAYGVYRYKHMTEADQEASSTSDYTESSSSDNWKSHHYTSEPRQRFGQSQSHSSSSASGTSTGNGFWTGAAAGGLLGYLFGQNSGHSYGYGRRPYYGYGYGNTGGGFFNSGYGGGWSSGSGWSSGGGWPSGGGWSSSGSHRSSHSSGSRTASGFGGTTRR